MSDRNRLNGASVMPAMVTPQTPPPATSAKPVSEGRRNGSRRSTSKVSGQRFKMLNDFVDITMQQLTPRQTAVWLRLFRDSRNGTATSEQGYIALRCGLRRPTVSTTIRELEVLGLVVIIYRGGINRGFSRYRVCAVSSTG